MFIYYIMSIVIVMIGIWVFVSSRKHLLSMLLSLEFIVLGLFFILLIFLNLMDYEVYFSMMFLTFSVCEGALGLSILVSMIRLHGNDYFQTFSLLGC